MHGFDGLACGLALHAALCRDHWDHVHPLPDNGDHELRVGSIRWLLTQTRTLCGALPVLQNADRSFSLTAIESARQRPLVTGATAQPAEGKPAPLTTDAITRAQRATPKTQLVSQLQGARISAACAA